MSRLNMSYSHARWRAIAGVDFPVLVTLLFRGWVSIAGGITVFLLPLWLSPIEQGYYFTFASVLTLQIFFELGLNQIVMQLVSHEVAHLTESSDGYLTGKKTHLGRLSSLALMTKRWYGVAALLFAAVGGVAGVVFFSQEGTQPKSLWLGAWVVLVAATAVNLWLSPRLAVMEGCGKVGQVGRLRLIQSVLGYSILWMALWIGVGLWATVAVPVVSAVCTACWLKVHGNTLHWLARRAHDLRSNLRWCTDVWPLQWRIALSWVSGYLIFNLFTPVVFSLYGAAEAGRLGMALAVFSAISSIGMSWVTVKIPNLAMHIARGERYELNALFMNVFVRSTVVIALTSTCVVSVVWYLSLTGLTLMTRIASPGVVVALAVATLVNSMVYAMAIYMRAHREEPMLIQSISIGLMISGVVYWSSNSSIFIMIFSYMLIIVFVSLPWTMFLFLRFFKRTD